MVHACTMITVDACSIIDHSTCMCYDHSACMYSGHRTCMYYDCSTCMYYDHSTCMCCGHSTCIMSYTAHVPSPLRRGGLGGLCPPREAGGFGGLQAPQWLTPDWGMRGVGGDPNQFRGMASSAGMIKAGLIPYPSHLPCFAL